MEMGKGTDARTRKKDWLPEEDQQGSTMLELRTGRRGLSNHEDWYTPVLASETRYSNPRAGSERISKEWHAQLTLSPHFTSVTLEQKRLRPPIPTLFFRSFMLRSDPDLRSLPSSNPARKLLIHRHRHRSDANPHELFARIRSYAFPFHPFPVALRVRPAHQHQRATRIHTPLCGHRVRGLRNGWRDEWYWI